MSRPAGRRVARRPERTRVRFPRPGADLVVALVAVLVAAATLATVAGPEERAPEQARPPGATALTAAELVCPTGAEISMARIGAAPTGAAPDVAVPDDAAPSEGSVTATTGASEPRALVLEPGGSTDIPAGAEATTTLRATGRQAPGLIAASFGPGAAAECVAPSGDWWFAGVGAGGLHVSTLTLTNPDQTPAIADLEIWGAKGPVASDATRGLAVAGGETLVVDLSEIAPQREDTVVHVIVRQGRLGATMGDRTVVGARDRDVAHPATTAPSIRAVLPAIPGAGARMRLVVGNPGEESGRAEVRISGAASASAPVGLESIAVPAGEVVSIDLDRAARKLLRSGNGSLVVESTVPLVSSVRGTAGGGPAVMAAVAPSARRSAVLLPRTSERTLVLMTAAGATPVTVHFDTAQPWEGRLLPQASTVVPVPEGARIAWVETSAPHLGAVRGRSARGPVWMPVRELREYRRVPVVAPDQLRSF